MKASAQGDQDTHLPTAALRTGKLAGGKPGSGRWEHAHLPAPWNPGSNSLHPTVPNSDKQCCAERGTHRNCYPAASAAA